MITIYAKIWIYLTSLLCGVEIHKIKHGIIFIEDIIKPYNVTVKMYPFGFRKYHFSRRKNGIIDMSPLWITSYLAGDSELIENTIKFTLGHEIGHADDYTDNGEGQ